VADAPAHGNDWHDITVDDRYPRGDPHGRCPAALVSSMAERQIDLTVFKCSSNMDTMVRRFHAAHTEGASRPGGAGANANFVLLNVEQQLGDARKSAGVRGGAGLGAPARSRASASGRGGSRMKLRKAGDALDDTTPESAIMMTEIATSCKRSYGSKAAVRM
jgi:hypothetical protein